MGSNNLVGLRNSVGIYTFMGLNNLVGFQNSVHIYTLRKTLKFKVETFFIP